MIKFASMFFVFFLTCIACLGLSTIIFSNTEWIETAIDYSGIGLLGAGVILIIALIIDRLKDAKEEKENDHFKKL